MTAEKGINHFEFCKHVYFVSTERADSVVPKGGYSASEFSAQSGFLAFYGGLNPHAFKNAVILLGGYRSLGNEKGKTDIIV